jgi:hypothetical protein
VRSALGIVVDDLRLAGVAADRDERGERRLGAMGHRDARGGLDLGEHLVGPAVDPALAARVGGVGVGARGHAGEEVAVAGGQVERAAGVAVAAVDAHAAGAELVGLAARFDRAVEVGDRRRDLLERGLELARVGVGRAVADDLDRRAVRDVGRRPAAGDRARREPRRLAEHEHGHVRAGQHDLLGDGERLAVGSAVERGRADEDLGELRVRAVAGGQRDVRRDQRPGALRLAAEQHRRGVGPLAERGVGAAEDVGVPAGVGMGQGRDPDQCKHQGWQRSHGGNPRISLARRRVRSDLAAVARDVQSTSLAA